MGYKKSYEAARQELRAAIGLLKKQKEENKNSESMYAVTGVITDDNKVLIAGNYYQYALICMLGKLLFAFLTKQSL